MPDDHAKEIAAGNVPQEGLLLRFRASRLRAMPRPRRRPELGERKRVASTPSVVVERFAGRFDVLAAAHEFMWPLLEMDKQGLDLQVLQGALRWMGHFFRLQSEVSTS